MRMHAPAAFNFFTTCHKHAVIVKHDQSQLVFLSYHTSALISTNNHCKYVQSIAAAYSTNILHID
jgi:hypothetical protein